MTDNSAITIENTDAETATKPMVLRLVDLKVDPTYQRSLKKKHKTIAKNFDPTVFGRLLVGERSDGTMWVVDGLQRCSALLSMGREYVVCDVFKSDGSEHEAEKFTKINNPKARSNLSPSDMFRGMLGANNLIALTIKQVAEEEGFVVTMSRSGTGSTSETRAKQLTCISTMVKIVEEKGADALRFALNTIARSWPNDPHRTSILIVGSLALFYHRRNGIVNTNRLIPRLQDTSPLTIYQSAKILSTMHFSGDQFGRGCEVIDRIDKKRKVGH